MILKQFRHYERIIIPIIMKRFNFTFTEIQIENYLCYISFILQFK